MPWHPAKDAVQRLWGRRWVRRVSYVLVAGACTLTVVPWLVTRPAVVHWTLDKVNAALRERMKSNPLGGPAFSSMVDFSAHRDYLARTNATYK